MGIASCIVEIGSFIKGIDPLTAFSGIVAFSTVVYAYLTWKLVSETRRMREVQTEPRIGMYLERYPPYTYGGISLVICNEGQGPARSLEFEFEGDSSYFGDASNVFPAPEVGELPAIRDGVTFLAARQTLRYFLGMISPQELNRASEHPWTFHISYMNLTGTVSKDTLQVDFSILRGIASEPSDLGRIASALENIQSDLASRGPG